LDSIQFFSGSFGESTFSALVYLQADREGLSMTILNELGLDMGSLSYSGNRLSFSSPYFSKDIKAEYILLDFQNCYYDRQELERHYAASGLTFSWTSDGDRETRLIQDGGMPIEEIIKEGDSITIRNLLRSYRYELRAAE
jgi:hypothetical protein